MQTWPKLRKGLLKFNSLCEMVKTQRAKEETGSTVENYLRTWCRPGWNARLAETTNEGMPIHRMLWMKRRRRSRQ
jgi:hypothetical protein